jgi:hypothetical protein
MATKAKSVVKERRKAPSPWIRTQTAEGWKRKMISLSRAGGSKKKK